jgi:hypothetical protein
LPDLPPLATVADIQARTDVEQTVEKQARAAVQIADASAIIRARVPELSDPPPRDRTRCDPTALLRTMAG